MPPSAGNNNGPTTPGTVNFSFTTIFDSTPATVTYSLALHDALPIYSSAHGPLATGSYSFKAHYNGDTFYGQADSLCEPLEVTALTPIVSTEIRDEIGRAHV